MSKCVLCGEPLDKYPTNKEHYVPQVLIREFSKLAIPSKYDWAFRTNEHSSRSDEESVSTPIKNHKIWAVVKVHEKCNLDASPMCQDLRYIIDNIDHFVTPFVHRSELMVSYQFYYFVHESF